ncbi:MAG: hypothetical protein J6L90_06435 [Clostridia bacterium]|nr:hypothetical protein [Clostridia bacterium]
MKKTRACDAECATGSLLFIPRRRGYAAGLVPQSRGATRGVSHCPSEQYLSIPQAYR